MRDILVTENIAGAEMDTLQRAFDVAFEPELWKSPEKLHAMIGNFRALMVRNQTRVDRELIAAGKNLIVIGRAGVGLDNVDGQAASDAGIVVAFTPEQNSISVAELAMGLMLSLARQIPSANQSAMAGKWERAKFTGCELFGKTLGIVGLGRIGFLTAMRARAFGMDIVAHDNFVSADSFVVSESRAKLIGLGELMASSDFVSVHLPETSETRGLFSFDRLSRMKPSAFFINTSRGGVVDEAALVRALREKKIAGAALDVRATEPPMPGELEAMENVILTPHIAAFTREGQDRVVSALCKDVSAVLRGDEAKNFVNFAKPKRS